MKKTPLRPESHNKDTVQKAAGLDLLQGRAISPHTGYTRTPGQVPSRKSNHQQTPILDPELDRALNAKPKPWSHDRMADVQVFTTRDVVKGLGLSKAMENRLQGIVARGVMGAPNVLEVKRNLMATLLQEAIPAPVRQIVNRRAQQLYGRFIEKSGQREIYSPEDYMMLRKAFEEKGGHYHAKVKHKGKTRYYYDPDKYHEKHGHHSHGSDVRTKHIGNKALECIDQAGGECELKAFKDLVKQYGHKAVHAAMKGHCDSGEACYSKGKFKRKAKKK